MADPVTLDESSLQVWGLQGAGYCVRLVGELDDAWADSFALSQQAQGDPGRFYIDRRRKVLVFSTVNQNDPGESLAQGRALLEVTNIRTGRVIQTRTVSPPISEPSGARPAATRASQPLQASKRLSREATRLEDTRGSRRVGASWMVRFSAGDKTSAEPRATGMTHDLSDTGLFVVTNRLPAVGERVNLTVYTAAQNRIDFTGEVVRVTDKDEAWKKALRPGFAAKVTASFGAQALRLLLTQGNA